MLRHVCAVAPLSPSIFPFMPSTKAGKAPHSKISMQLRGSNKLRKKQQVATKNLTTQNCNLLSTDKNERATTDACIKSSSFFRFFVNMSIAPESRILSFIVGSSDKRKRKKVRRRKTFVFADPILRHSTVS